MLAKVPSGTLANIVSEVNIAKTEICCINNSFEEIEINDVLENILLLLKFNMKSLIWQQFFKNFGKKVRTIFRCLICLTFLYTMLMTWYNKVIKKNIEETFSSAYIYILSVVILGIWSYFSGHDFTWKWIEPIDPPSLLSWSIYSALTYITLGAFLYYIKFFRFLYRISSSYRDFKKSKKELWPILVAIVAFIIVPKTIELLNAILSIGYNIFYFLLFAFPSFVISVLLVGAYFYFRYQKTRPTVLNTTSEKSL